MAVDLNSQHTHENESVILNLKDALIRGKLPQQKGEIVISDGFAEKLEVHPGETATLITKTMCGGLTTTNLIQILNLQNIFQLEINGTNALMI